jgi:hypothetical protein
MQKLSPKIDSLVTPDTADSLQSLGNVITSAKVAPAGGYVNYSKSGVLMQHAQSLGEGILAAKTGGLSIPIIKSLKGRAERQWAQQSANPNVGKLSDLAR